MSNIYSMARLGRTEEVRRLIAEGADLSAFSVHGFPPLLLAVREGRTETVQLLLKSGADPNLTGSKGQSPLDSAVSNKWTDIIMLLLEAGANPNATGGFGPIIVQAAMANRRDLVDLLSNAGANPNAKGHKDMTANEWLECGGIQGYFASSMKFPREKNAKDESIANEKDHERVRKMMAEGYSPDEYMARHGRNILIWSAARAIYSDQEMNDWAHRVADILNDSDLLFEAERKYLTGDELKKAKQRWRSNDRRRRRTRSR